MVRIPIQMYNVCIMDVEFRIIDRLYNSGRIIVDRDTFNFAGRITDDVLIGLYEDGKYEIHYYYNELDEYDYTQSNCREMVLPVKYPMKEIQDLERTIVTAENVKLQLGEISINKAEIKKVLDNNQDLVVISV